MEILKVNEVKKTYTSRFGGNRVQALKGVTFSVQEGEYVAPSWASPAPAKPPC